MKWDELATLPLFIGMSREELEGIMTQLRIDFKKYDAGKVIVRRGDPCGKLVIVNQGDILCQARSDDGAFSMEETSFLRVCLSDWKEAKYASSNPAMLRTRYLSTTASLTPPP